MKVNAKFQKVTDENDAICPYCGEAYQVDSEEYSEDARSEICSKCGKKYWLFQCFDITHHTIPDCTLNGGEHQYKRDNRMKSGKFCTICNDFRFS